MKSPLTQSSRLDTCSSLIKVFNYHLKYSPSKLVYRFLENGQEVSGSRTYQELYDRSHCIATHILSQVSPGDCVVLLYPSGLDFIDAFFGCLLAGVIAVPSVPLGSKRHTTRLKHTVMDSGAKLFLTTDNLTTKSKAWFEDAVCSDIPWLSTDIVTHAIEDIVFPEINSDTIAFLQYTSGSTGTPKGVMVDHSNMTHNSQLIQECFHHTTASVGVGWLPIYHDMGLIGNILQPFYVGFEIILMPPTAFVQKPIRWLRAISKYKATTSGGPNFAYDLCIDKITKEDLKELDLSSWRVAFNGAEPIHSSTLDRFVDYFKEFGFKASAFLPCYGMAETTLIVSGVLYNSVPNRLIVNTTAFESGCIKPEATTVENPSLKKLISNGPVLGGLSVKIVDPVTLLECPDDQTGELWVMGASVAKGYWNNAKATEVSFGAYINHQEGQKDGPYLRTGDLGFLHEGEVYVSGRLKELMIINGANHYPQDIEHTIQLSDDALQAHCGGAFTIEDIGTTQLVVVQEIKRSHLKDLNHQKVITAIQQAVMVNHQLVLDSIVLVSPGRVSKTSSGKIRRLALQKSYLTEELKGVLFHWSKDPLVEQETTSKTLSEGSTVCSANEQWLRAALAEVLQVKSSQIGDRTSFAALGMDSLAAISLAGKISDHFGISCDASLLFEYSTIKEVSNHIDKEQLARDSSTPNLGIASSIQAHPKDREAYPVSYAQEALWLIDQLEGSLGYHIPRVLHSPTQLDIELLQKTMVRLLERHPILRTVIIEKEGVPYQQVQSSDIFAIDVLVLSPTDDLDDHLYQQLYRPFALSKDAMVRLSVVHHPDHGYYLVFVFHHIACDGLSEPTLVGEFMETYRSLCQDKEVVLPALPLQYTDYALWQHSAAQQEQIQESLKYWKAHLKGVGVLQLPYDIPKGTKQEYRGKEFTFALDSSLSTRLIDFCKDQQVTVFMSLLSTFKVLMYRYSGQKDICVGVPSANRVDPALKDMVGMFVNTLPIRTQIDAQQSIVELLQKIKSSTLQGYRHQCAPFEKIVSVVLPERQEGVNPIFQVSFGAHTIPDVQLVLQEEEGLTHYPVEHQYPNFDLSFTVDQQQEGISIRVHYRNDRFSEAMIERMVGHYQVLLEGMVKNPAMTVSELPILTQAEEDKLLVEWNDTKKEYPQDKCIHELFEAQVEQTPDAIALVFEEEQLTYRELNSRANQLANYLRPLGVGPEILVGICVERSTEMMVGLLGILKAGGAYVPIDPTYPKERIAYMLEDAQVPVLLTQQKLVDHLPTHQAQVVCLDTDWLKIAEESQENLISSVESHHLAYMIYTSGSTGRPKGVMIEHKGISNRLLWMQDTYQLTSADKVMQKTPFSFDVSVWELFWPFMTGACLVVAKPEGHKDSAYMVELIKELKITTLHFVPSILQVFVEEQGLEDCYSIKHVICSGEVLPVDLQERFFQRLGCQLHNLYGPTEAAIDVTFWECKPSNSLATVPIGSPIANTQIYILDKHQHPVPIGVSGELYIGGVGLARGYHNQPQLTVEKFIADPFSKNSQSRLYKTGDLARYLPDGNIEFLGRIDHQVKIRGFRIELGEIESVLSQHPEVGEVVVIAREDIPGDKRLVAYIITQNKETNSTLLKRYLKDKLPDYMVPSAFFVLDVMPLTLNGKIDRKALPALDSSSLITQDYVAPRNATEKAMVAIWQEVLGIEKIGINDNFFELGGHSLQAAKLVSKLSKSIHGEITISLLFKYPNIFNLAFEIDKLNSKPDEVMNLESTDRTAQVIKKMKSSQQIFSPFLQLENRSLLTLFSLGKIDSVDAAAIAYFPISLVSQMDLNRDEIINEWFDNLPVLFNIIQTQWGRIALIFLPRFSNEIYDDQKDLINSVIEALELAGNLGAKIVSLTGTIPSATNYGISIAEAISQRQDLPKISTGHAATSAAVVLSIKKILQKSGRNLSKERVACIGLGSIGQSSLYLMLRCLPHPQEIMLCDLYSNRELLEHIKDKMVNDYGFQGVITIVESRVKVPKDIYQATFMIGATNAPNVIDVDNLRPGTILVDDSAPHCFAPKLAVKRFSDDQDILFTEGGVLKSPEAITKLVYWPHKVKKLLGTDAVQSFFNSDPSEITGCIFSSLLCAKYNQLKPTIGLVEIENAFEHYKVLNELNFQAADLHCEGYVLEEELVNRFHNRFKLLNQGSIK